MVARPFAIGVTWTADIDALAVRMGSGAPSGRGPAAEAGGYVRLNRSKISVPPATNERIGFGYASSCGTLVRIEIERATGHVRIAKAYSVFECGQALVPQVVVGQAQGGFAMGVGQALLEHRPVDDDGPGNGKWNLGQYVVARASDLPVRDLQIEVLPPLSPNDPPKGMAEVVMIPVVPALVNAIADATGTASRCRSQPCSEGAPVTTLNITIKARRTDRSRCATNCR